MILLAALVLSFGSALRASDNAFEAVEHAVDNPKQSVRELIEGRVYAKRQLWNPFKSIKVGFNTAVDFTEDDIITPLEKKAEENPPLWYSVYGACLLAFIGICVLLCCLCCAWRAYEHGLFHRTDLSKIQRMKLQRWKLKFPEENASIMEQKKGSTLSNSPPECIVTWDSRPRGWRCFTLNATLPQIKKYMYFELEVLENKAKAQIVIGLCKPELFKADGLPEEGEGSVYIYGRTGELYHNGKKFGETNYRVERFGTVGGMLLYWNKKKNPEHFSVIPTSGGIQCPKLTQIELDEMREKEEKSKHQEEEEGFLKNFESQMRNGVVDAAKKKKYDEIMERREKEAEEEEKKRAEIAKAKRKARINPKLLAMEDYELFVAVSDSCKLRLNLGQKVFTNHNEAYDKGILV